MRGPWPLRVSTVMSALAVCGRWGYVRQSGMSERTPLAVGLYCFLYLLLYLPLSQWNPNKFISDAFFCFISTLLCLKRKCQEDYYTTIDSCLERASCQIKGNYV